MNEVTERESTGVWFDHGPKIIGLLVLVLALLQQTSGTLPGVFLVDGLNLSAGVSLARGGGLTFAHLPGSPDAASWLPGYPAVLSVLVRMWPEIPENMALVQLTNSLALAGAAWALSASFRTVRFPVGFFDLAVVLAFGNPLLLGLTSHPFAEPLFLALVLAGLGLIDRERSNVRAHAVAGVLVTFGALTLVPGSVVLVAAVAAPVIRRHWRASVAALIPAAVLVGAWRGITERGDGTAATTLALARDYDPLGATLGSVLSGGWAPAAIPVVIIVLFLFGWGALALARQRPGFVVAATGMVAFVLAWPDPPSRWVAVSIPFVLPPVTVGLRRAWGVRRELRPVVLVLAIGWGALYGASLLRGTVNQAFAAAATVDWNRVEIALASVRQELPEDAVIASDADALVFLVGDRLAVPVHRLELDDGLGVACERGATHLLWLGVGGERPASLSAPPTVNRVRPLFSITDGPGLFDLQCSS